MPYVLMALQCVGVPAFMANRRRREGNSRPLAAAAGILALFAPMALQCAGELMGSAKRRRRPMRRLLPSAAETPIHAPSDPIIPLYVGEVTLWARRRRPCWISNSLPSVAAGNTLAPLSPTAPPCAGASMTVVKCRKVSSSLRLAVAALTPARSA